MQKNSYKILCLIVGVLIIVFICFLFVKNEKNDFLLVSFFDVGQGDAIFIRTPENKKILIDGGEGDIILEELGKKMKWYERKIDLVVLTHPHDDHVGGLIGVLKKYNVSKIIYTGIIYNSPAYLSFLEKIKEENIFLKVVDGPEKILFEDNLFLDIIFPMSSLVGQKIDNLNNSSIVSMLNYKKCKFLFMGDAEIEVEKVLKSFNVNADLIKIGHHGSDTSSSKDFLERVNPKIAVIQVGEGNDFGHPSRRTLKTLERLSVEIFRNDLMGTLDFFSDGVEIFLRKY